MKTRMIVVLSGAALGLVGFAALQLLDKGDESKAPAVAPGPRQPAETSLAEGRAVVSIPEPEPEPEVVPEPEPEPVEASPRMRGDVTDFVPPPAPVKTTLTGDNASVADLQQELQRAEEELARRKELFGRAEWSRGEWQEHVLGQGMPRPQLSWDGIPEDLYWRRAKNAVGEPVLRVVSLPFERYPEYYDLKREASRLRGELRLLVDD